MGWHGQQLNITVGLLSHHFRAQTHVTAFDIGLDIFSEARPIVFTTDKLFCFIDTKMAYQRVIVMFADELSSNNFRYKQ